MSPNFARNACRCWKRRIAIGLDHPVLASALRRIHVWPITVDVCRNMLALDFSSNPADELIAATSLSFGAPLVTRDARIRASRLVDFA